MANINDSVTQNLLPVQAYFNLDGTFNTFIGQNMPFYATINPVQSGLTITNSTIDSSTIGATTPSTGIFTNVSGTTGQISTTPSSNTDIANKFYVDTVAQGLGPKAACAVGTTANITLSGLQTIDGYTTLAGDRVLVKNQSSSQYNGIYIASANAWTRAVDMDVWSEVPGAYTVILNGGQSNTGWVCTASATGTINVTAMPWVQFSGSATYFAGTGLTLASNTFSITNVGTAGTYGSASSVPVFTTNAQGQITSVTNTSIAIANTQVSGLGTMSTQNANNVSITGGSITGTPISGSTVGGTTITASTQFSGSGTGLTGTASGLSIGGNAATATTATTASAVANSLTFNNSGSGAASGTTFNGSAAQTISYNTIGAPSTTGTGASGTWGIGISGNAATVTNGVYTTGSYSNPSWITSILGSIVSGAVASATTATNLAGGLAGSLPYQSGSGATTFLGIGSANYVLTSSGTAPQYVAQSTLSVGSATTATTATNLAGGAASQIPYQSASGTTAFVSNGTTGQFLQSNGTSAPTWATPTSYATVTDDTTTNGTRYPLFANQTSGNLSTEYTSSTKLQYNPSTGALSATSFVGTIAGSNVSGNISGNAANVTGTVAITNGGTGQTTASGAFNALSPITTTGDLIIGNGSNSATRLPIGANTYILTSNGTTATWSAAPVTGITITDDTSTNATRYLTFTSATSGTITTENTSSTKLYYNPSTGQLNATTFAGSGSNLTGIVTSAVAGSGISVSSATGAVTIANTSPMVYPSAGIPNSTGSAWGTSYTTTGSGTVVALATSPSFTTPTLGVASATSVSASGTVTGAELIASNGIIVNNMTIAASYSIPSGYGASSTGPVTVSSGQSVTVPSGSRWVIL
jgi:hypothetical protein